MFGGPGRQERQIVWLAGAHLAWLGEQAASPAHTHHHTSHYGVWEGRNDNNYVKYELLVLNNNMADNMEPDHCNAIIKVKYQSGC